MSSNRSDKHGERRKSKVKRLSCQGRITVYHVYIYIYHDFYHSLEHIPPRHCTTPRAHPPTVLSEAVKNTCLCVHTISCELFSPSISLHTHVTHAYTRTCDDLRAVVDSLRDGAVCGCCPAETPFRGGRRDHENES